MPHFLCPIYLPRVDIAGGRKPAMYPALPPAEAAVCDYTNSLLTDPFSPLWESWTLNDVTKYT